MKKLRLTPHLTVCMIGFSYIASSSVIAPILSIYLKDVIHAPVEMVGLVTAMFFIASALAKLSSGVFGGGRKTITFLLLAFVIFSICPALYPLTDSITALIVLRTIQGFAYAFIGTASLILAALAISSLERDKGVGAYTASLSLGFLAGPAMVAEILKRFAEYYPPSSAIASMIQLLEGEHFVGYNPLTPEHVLYTMISSTTLFILGLAVYRQKMWVSRL